jgi:thioredoxin-related protein
MTVATNASAQSADPRSARIGTPAPRGAPTDHYGQPPADLPAKAAIGFQAGKPLVLMFSLRGCPWCDALRREHFEGLQLRQESERVLAFEVDMTDSRQFGAGGSTGQVTGQAASHPPATGVPPGWGASSPRELARQFRIRLAPTVLFLGPQGEIAERLVGYGSPDFYGAYLEQRIAQSRAALTQR